MKRSSSSLALMLCGLLAFATTAQADDNHSHQNGRKHRASNNQTRNNQSSDNQRFSNNRDRNGTHSISEFAKQFKKKHHDHHGHHHDDDHPSDSPVRPMPPITIDPVSVSDPIIRDHRKPTRRPGQRPPLDVSQAPGGVVVTTTPGRPRPRPTVNVTTFGQSTIVVRDHRKPTGPIIRDHREETGPVIRDHRTPKGPIVRDHRDPTGPVIRDHRTSTGPVIRDHRTK